MKESDLGSIFQLSFYFIITYGQLLKIHDKILCLFKMGLTRRDKLPTIHRNEKSIVIKHLTIMLDSECTKGIQFILISFVYICHKLGQ